MRRARVQRAAVTTLAARQATELVGRLPGTRRVVLNCAVPALRSGNGGNIHAPLHRPAFIVRP